MSNPNKKEVIKKLKSDRKQIVAQLDRFHDYISKCNQLTNKLIINERGVKCETLWDEFNKIQLELEYLDESQSIATDRTRFEEQYFETICLFKELQGNGANSTVVDQNSPLVSTTVKLPPLDLPSFSGSYDSWSTFFDTFVALIHSPYTSLTDVQKFYYLQSCLKGEAAQVISSIPATDLNYEIAFNLLRERYENQKLIIQSHLKCLFEIQPVIKNGHNELRKFVDTIQKNIRALKSQDEPTEYWDTILVYLFNTKLDLTLKRDWETYSVKCKSVKLNDFINFVTEKCQVLESVETNKSSFVKCSPQGTYNKPHDRSTRVPYRNTSQSFVSTQDNCLICKRDKHSISHCSRFLNLTEVQRVAEIKKLHLCLNCLKPNHLSVQCTFNGCRKCNKPHNTLLHIDYSKANNSNNDKPSEGPKAINPNNDGSSEGFRERSQVSSHTCMCENNRVSSKVTNNNKCEKASFQTTSSVCDVLLSTAKVLVSNNYGDFLEARVLLDSGSQSNFITSDLVSRLNSSVEKVNMSVVGINSSVTETNKLVRTTIKSKYNAFSETLPFFVLNKITGNLPTTQINKRQLNIPSNINLADPSFDIPGPIDMLLGVGVFYELLAVGQIRTASNLPILQKTKLGWVISGNIPGANESKLVVTQTVCGFASKTGIEEQMEMFWKLEEIQPIKILKKEERECEELFVKSTKQADDGRFIVELPTHEGVENIGDSKEMAIKRFHKLEKKLLQNEEVKGQYIEFMSEYERLGHMTEVLEGEIETKNPTYYMPHHPVLKEDSTTTKLRVVFDASAKTNQRISLNERLKKGPIIQDQLYSILLRFREHNVVIGADIEKTYRQIWIKSEQRDLQRIVWRADPEEKLRHYRLNTVTYGTTAASFLAIKCLHMAAEENKGQYPMASEEIKSNFYVDDLLTGASSVEEAVKLKNEISAVLKKSGFNLRKWMSNKREVLDKSEEQADVKHYLIDETVTKTLGIAWNIQDDFLTYNVKIERSPKVTKRNILSVISRLFDPLGLIGPVIVGAKILMQKLWNENRDWDEPVSQELRETWLEIYNELPILNNLHLPRHAICVYPMTIELHGYCDASERAYGACIYLRSINEYGDISTHLLCAKSKVAPIKTVTLPRLELCGALLLSRLMNKTVGSLRLKANEIFYWTDSQIVLAWLAAEAANWNVFVAHRVAEIQQNTDIKKWRHVPTETNPADLISRPCTPTKLINCPLWWTGPNWLTKSNEEWPKSDQMLNNNSEIEERRKTRQVFVNSLEQDIFSKFSTLLRLQRVIAHCIRFYKNVSSQKHDKLTGNLLVDELEQALIYLVKVAQSYTFSTEIKHLELNKTVPHKSKISSLNPFLDSNKLLRVGGRLGKSNVSFDQKHPIILEKNHLLTTLIIKHEHKQNLHMGPQNLLANIRTRFWILGGINTIKGVLRSCIICFRVKPKNLNALMGELPEQRLVPTKPFFNSGVDYAGPFNIKSSKLRYSKILNAYLCIFVCFVTKAVHLEVVSDLTTESFLNALKRFIARRGKCQNMYSDCGTNFVGANNEMREFYKFLNNDDVKNRVTDYLAKDRIKWNFIPPRSPHFGGLWETNVKQAKYYLKRILGNAALTFEELTTVFAQIEAVINSRPLSPMSNDPSDLTPLTPGHFLVGDALTALPEPDVREIQFNRLNRYQHLTQLVQHFWSRWYKECLCEINKRSKWKYPNGANIKIGDMVILKEENLPPLKWALGRVENTYPGSDGIVRVVKVKTERGSYKRAIAKVCLLPLD